MDVPARPSVVWIVEDDAGYRDALVAALAPAVQQAFETIEDALAWAAAVPADAVPDVALLDINLPGMTGIEGLAGLKAHLPATRFVMLTIRDDAETVYAALGAGASGYVLKSAGADEIAAAVAVARTGGMLMPAPVARLVLAQFAPDAPAPDYGLSPRERDVLAEMTGGFSQKEIAARLFISVSTVNSHVQSLYDKLHVRTASAAVAKAVRERLVADVAAGREIV